MSRERIPLYYTFGNHMHWVDMEWLWGYQVLPDSVRDMLALCAATGAKGNINFDAIGYEKLAVEAPEALAELRDAVARSVIEVVGASYGQPYGLFHGGESNIRQRVYGVHSVMRLLGTRPRTFWEEEFDFFPQLPQMLRGVGYEYGSLFFQWTWHTPIVPREEHPAVAWEGLDGSTLLSAARNALNLHQWPEDFAGLLEGPTPREMPAAGIVQWLELMPSPDWMCRSELLLPQLRSLMQHPDFEIRPVTLSEYLEVARPHAVRRRYTMDDVFHGMSLGKNGDNLRRLSRRGEQQLLTAEALSSLAGLLGRPYPSWSVYPVWELEEAWRELLAAQHHDNDECEGLCGFVGRRSYERSLGLSEHVVQRTMRLLVDRASGKADRRLLFNPLGWSRSVASVTAEGEAPSLVELPPFGYRVLEPGETGRRLEPTVGTETAASVTLKRGQLEVVVDRASGLLTQIVTPEFPEGMLSMPLAKVAMVQDGRREQFDRVEVSLSEQCDTNIYGSSVVIKRMAKSGGSILITISIPPDRDAVDIAYQSHDLPRPDGRMHSALQTTISPAIPSARLIHDHPYGVSEIRAEGTYLRKYPTGDWMTSPQVFEEVHNPFTALQFVDFDAGDRGMLYLHDGSQAFFRDGDQVNQILSMYDPWDEDYFDPILQARIRIVPHGPLSNAERWRMAQEFTRPALVATSDRPGGELPAMLAPVWCDTAGVAVTALFRESEVARRHLDAFAGAGMDIPYVLRLVELNGETTTAHLRFPGDVAKAVRANLLGEAETIINARAADAPEGMPGAWSGIELELRPYEIATVYLDLVAGRKVDRNLDDYRSVWATIHRVDAGD